MHSIRLRGPWRYEVLEHSGAAGEPTPGDLPSPGKQKMPADWAEKLGADFYGTVRYTRTFHQPTGLEEGQGVWLVVEGAHTRASVSLNDSTLSNACVFAAGTAEPPRWPIEHLLLPTNKLIIDVEHSATDKGIGGLTGQVRLEIQTVRPRPVD